MIDHNYIHTYWHPAFYKDGQAIGWLEEKLATSLTWEDVIKKGLVSVHADHILTMFYDKNETPKTIDWREQ